MGGSKSLFVVLHWLSHVQLFVTPRTSAYQAPLSFTISQSSLKFMSIESVMPSNDLILCHPLLLLPSVFPSIRVFSSELALHTRWSKYWSFSFGISPSKEHPGLISFRMEWLDLLAVQGTSRAFSNITVQKHQFQVRCTILDAWGWCTGTTQRDGMGRKKSVSFLPP